MVVQSEERMFIGGFQHVPLSDGMFHFLWMETDKVAAASWPWQDHKDYILMLMGV